MVEKAVAVLLEENAELRHRLRESEEILNALRAEKVDAITVQTKFGVGVFTLKGAEQPYREMVETMSEGAVTIGADGIIIYCNQRFADMLQLDLASVMGTRLVAHFAERDRIAITSALNNKCGDITRITTEMLGGKKSIPVAMAIRADASSHLVLVVSDMTEISEAQEEVARSSALLDNILQSSIKYSVIGASLDHKIIFWNEGARRNYGYASEEMIGQPLDLLYAPEVRASVAQSRLVETAREQGIAEGEFERIRKDGTRFTAQIVMSRRDDVAGNPIGFLVISNDISDQQRAAEELRSVSQYARNLLEACLDPLITINPEGIITDVNHATELITGQIRQRLIGSDFAIWFSEPEKARCAYQRVFAKGFLIDTKLAIRHVARTVTEVLCNASLYHDAGGKVAGVFLVARDISRMGSTDLTPPAKPAGLKWRRAGLAAAAVAFVSLAIILPSISRLALQEPRNRHSLVQLTVTNSRMQSLLHEVSPTPARVQAALVQQAGNNLGPSYTITYAVAAPNHEAGAIGKEQLLSRFANHMTALLAGRCGRVSQTTSEQETDLIVCPVTWDAELRGLLLMSWDKGDAAPVDFDAALAALQRSEPDFAAIWFDK